MGMEPTGVVGIIPTANIQHFNPKVKSFDKYFYFGSKIFAAIATYSMGNIGKLGNLRKLRKLRNP